MKTLTFSIDLKSFFFGVLTIGGILTMANFTPADKSVPATNENRRFQAISNERETLILDTQTGRFVYAYPSIGQRRWNKEDFEELQNSAKGR